MEMYDKHLLSKKIQNNIFGNLRIILTFSNSLTTGAVI